MPRRLAASLALALTLLRAVSAEGRPALDGPQRADSLGEHWVYLSPGGVTPAMRQGASLTYDPAGQRFLMFGGWDSRNLWNDLWSLENPPGAPTSWRLLPAGTRQPSPRTQHSAVLDTHRRRLVVFGGENVNGNRRLNDVWIRDLSVDDGAWRTPLMTDAAPAPRFGAAAIYDAANERMVLFGGDDRITSFGDVWSLDLSQEEPEWTRLAPRGSVPYVRSQFVAAYDEHAGRMVVFSGFIREAQVQLSDVHYLWLDPGAERWERADVRGPAPSARMDGIGVYDARHQRLVIRGGWNSSNSLGVDDVWAFDLGPGASGWERLLPPGGGPAARVGVSAGYDEAGGRIMTFGGYRGEGQFSAEVWGLDLGGVPPTPTATTTPVTPPTPTEPSPTASGSPSPTAEPTQRGPRAFLPRLVHFPPPLPTPPPTATATATPLPCGLRDVEPNELVGHANANPALCADGTAEGTLADGDTMDVYRIELTGDVVADFILFGLPAGTNYDLELFDASRTRLAVSEAPGTTPEHIRRALAAGRYYVRVITVGGHSDSTYSLRWFQQ